jgi:hypothetical protein
MTELDDSIKQALRQNGTVDEEKTKQLQERAISKFRKKMRAVERYALGFMLLFTVMAGLAWNALIWADSVRMQIFAGIFFLMFLQCSILFQLLHSMMTNKLAVLKEIQFLRLGIREEPDLEIGWHGHYLPKVERFLYHAGLAATCIVLFGLLPNYKSLFWQQGSRVMQRTTVLQADGSGKQIIRQSLPYRGLSPRSTMEIRDGSSARDRMEKWYDGQGRELQTAIVDEGQNTKWIIFLIEPHLPGQWISYRREFEISDLAKEEDGLWTCRLDSTFGDRVDFTRTVTLPPGAQIQETTPEPLSITEGSNGSTITWQADTKKPYRFEREVKYRLTENRE